MFWSATQMPTWPTAWRQWGTVGTSAGHPWSGCGPAWASWAGTPSGLWPRNHRQAGSAPAAAGARTPKGEKRLRVSQQTDCIGVQEMSTFCLVWGFGRKDWGKSFEAFLPTFMTTGCSKLYMELDFLCRNFLNSGNNQARVKKQTGQLLLFV